MHRFKRIFSFFKVFLFRVPFGQPVDVVWIGNYLPKAIYFWDCGSNGGHVGAICSKVCEKGDVRTFLV